MLLFEIEFEYVPVPTPNEYDRAVKDVTVVDASDYADELFEQ